MGFKIKTFEELTISMITWIRAHTSKITDFAVGSRVRTIIEAVANELEELYIKVWQGLKTSIEENIYVAFDFALLPATKAVGTATFSRSTVAGQNYEIPIGTIVATTPTAYLPSINYETTATATLLQGTTSVIVPITAKDSGIAGNVAPGTVTVFITKPVGVEAVTNVSALTSGRNLETREERKFRFRDYSSTRSRGTVGALEYGALHEVQAVQDVQVIENPKVLALVFDGTTYIDISMPANNPFEVPVGVLPSVEKINDCLYVGALDKFNFVAIDMVTVGVGSTGVWEYATKIGWSAISGIIDNTNKLTKDGIVHFTPPLDWRDSKIGEVWAFWVRFRITTAGYTVTPTVGHILIAPPPGYVELYVHDGYGDATPELLAEVASKIETYRGHGITVNVKAPTKIFVGMLCKIKVNTLFASAEVQAQTKLTIVEFLTDLMLGTNYNQAKLKTAIHALYNAQAIEDVEIDLDDILVSRSEIVRPDVENINVVVIN